MAHGRLSRRWTAALAALGVVAVGALTAPPAVAETTPADPTNPATPVTVSADALPTVQIDGVVWSQVVVGRTVYVAGSFTTARPAGAAPGVSTVPRHNLLAFDIETGALVPGFAPVLDGQALSITASPDGTRVYVVGDFTKVDGQWRMRAAAFDTATGALVPSFRPTLSARALTVAASDDAVYVGGNFLGAASVTGGTLQPRSYLAAFSAATGEVTPFVADADAPVTALAVTADRSKLVVGGRFTQLSGAPVYGLGAVSPQTGAGMAFPANAAIRNAGTKSSITSLYADASGVYGTGYHFGGGGNLEGTFRAHASTGELIWVADCHGDAYSAFPVGDEVYTASHHHYCGNMGGFPQTEPWTFYRGNAFTKTVTGTNTPDIYGYPDQRGKPAPSLLTWFPDLTAGTYTGQTQAAWSVAGNADYVVMGGEFPRVNGTAQQGLVRFARGTKAPHKQGPVLAGAQAAPRLLSVAPGEVRVAWRGNWDRDNEAVTYQVFREGTATPIHTRTVTAPFWKVPATMSVTDTGRAPGSVQRYRVVATDPYGNAATSAWVAATVSGAAADGGYAHDVLGDDPSLYWRLGDTGTAVRDWAGFSDGVAGSGVTGGAAGALAGAERASTFDGTTSGFAASQSAQVAPNTFTVESWFRTTSTTGGKIVGYGGSATAGSSNYDRHVYLDNAGRVFFGVHPGSVKTVNSAASYNDGEWHHVVASLGSNGMRLYVDGKRVAMRTDVTTGQTYSGFWRVGGDTIGTSWTSSPTSKYLTGSIDEVAVYPSVLSHVQVESHYVSSGRTSSLPATPGDAYGAAVRAESPELYWRLGEATGPVARDTGLSGVSGTYRNGVRPGAAGALAGVGDTAAAFDGVSGVVTSDVAYTSPSTYSEELWFSTTTTNGGKLVGLGNRVDTTSTSHDRHVYMQKDGRLVFGTWTGKQNLVVSPLAYNDGAWHHLVATQSAEGMRLYVDGRLVGENPEKGAQSLTGYWRIGGDTAWNGVQPWFAGTIDEVAIYLRALSPETVAEHYALGAGLAPVNRAPEARFTTTASGLTLSLDGTGSVDPDGSVTGWAWDFGDGNGAAGSTARHTYASAGTYTVRLTVTDDKGATGRLEQTVTVAQPVNVAPTASFVSSVSGSSVSVDGGGSSDSDGSVTGYAWDFGDGSRGTGQKASRTYAAAGTYTVTLTVTDDRGATGSVSRAVTVSAPVAAGELARDAFGREVTSGWGSSEVGGAWTVSGTTSRYAVTGGAGVHRLTAAGSTTASSLAGVSSSDTEVQVRVSADKVQTGGGTYVTVVGRRVGTTVGSAEYAARVRLLADGSVSLAAMRAGTALQAVTVPGLSYVAGEQLQVRAQVTGTSPTTVRAKVWKVGAAEPTSWQVSTTDATAELQVAGSVGLTGYLSGSATNAPLTVAFDDLQAFSASAPPAANVAPTASFVSSVSDLAVAVDGGGSTDSDGTIAGYEWDFGDGSRATGRTASRTYAAAGTYTVTLTVTDDRGATGVASRAVTVTAPAPLELARDAFGREVTSGWGSSEVGGAWTVSGTTSRYAVTGGVGVQRLTAAGQTAASSLAGVSSSDTEVLVRVSADKAQTGGGTYVSVVGRRVGTTVGSGEYSGRLRLLADGSVTLAAMRAGTSLQAVTVPGLSYVAGEQLQVRVQVTGTSPTTVRAKVWKVGAAEPAGWGVSTTDATAELQVAGGVGLTSYLSGSSTNAPLAVSFDDLAVTRVG